MKKIWIFIFSCFIMSNLHSQYWDNNSVYLSTQISSGTYCIGVDFSINYLFKDNYSFQIGYSRNVQTAKSKPNDFESGLVSPLSLGIVYPRDRAEYFDFTIGEIFKFNKKGTVRLNFSIGVAYTHIRNVVNFEQVTSILGALVAGNYRYNYKKNETIGLIINPKFEFPITHYGGLVVSPKIEFNKYSTNFGVGFGIMLGHTRKKNLKTRP